MTGSGILNPKLVIVDESNWRGDFIIDPIISLDGGSEGLTAYQIIAKDAKRILSDNGTIIIEIAFDQAKDIEKIFINNNFLLQNKVKDYSGLDRIMVFSKKKVKK